MITHLLSINNLNKNDVEIILNLTKKIKENKLKNKILKDKYFVLIFQKPSLRTHLTFEIAINKLAGKTIFLTDNEIGLGNRESIKDIAKNLSNYCDGIIARVHEHNILVELSRYSTVSIINALSDLEHPTQVISDIFTIKEYKKDTGKIAYIGDGNNVCNSLILICSLLNLNLTVATPKEYKPAKEILYKVKNNIEVIEAPQEAVKDADIIYTDTWISMGKEKEKEKRLKVFKEYQINKELLKYAKKDCLIMHCLPAKRGYEITDEVMDSTSSIVFEQSKNRLYTTEAILRFIYQL